MVARNSAVQPGSGFLASRPNVAMSPAPIPIKLETTCTRVKVDVVMPQIVMRLLPRGSAADRDDLTASRWERRLDV